MANLRAIFEVSTFNRYDNIKGNAKYIQVALLWQRDRATRLSVEILQLQNIPFEN